MKPWMLRIYDSLRRRWEAIPNEALRRSLLQAIPFWVASFLTGLVAVAYAWLFGWAEDAVIWLAEHYRWWLFLSCPLFFLLSWWVVKRWAPAARGSGIPQVMAAIDLANPRDNHKVGYLLGLRVLLAKIASSLLLVLGGGAVGREGPTIQIAGSVFRFVQSLTPASWPQVPKRNMIITGAAAGLAAAFNTPLGGIVFAMEELARHHFRYFRTPLFAAVIIAGLTAQWLLGSYLYLGYPQVTGAHWWVLFPVMLSAAIAGVGGGAMGRMIWKLLDWKKRLGNGRRRLQYLLAAALAMALMGGLVTTQALGPGKEVMNDLLFTHQKEVTWYLPVVRFLGPVVSFTAGGAGGVFAPSLTAGATIGAVLSEAFNLAGANANLLILAGMVGFLTGLTRSPFTSAILVLEMTDRHSVIFHLMAAGMVSSLTAWLVDRRSLYEYLKSDYLREAHQSATEPPSDVSPPSDKPQ